MSKKTTGVVEATPISLAAIVEGIYKVLAPAADDVMKLICQIDLGEYKAIRADINAAFKVGEPTEFAGYVEEETEFGDVSDVIQGVLEERFPIEKVQGKAGSIMLTLEERMKWRDELIQELDEMVEQ